MDKTFLHTSQFYFFAQIARWALNEFSILNRLSSHTRHRGGVIASRDSVCLESTSRIHGLRPDSSLNRSQDVSLVDAPMVEGDANTISIGA